MIDLREIVVMQKNYCFVIDLCIVFVIDLREIVVMQKTIVLQQLKSI